MGAIDYLQHFEKDRQVKSASKKGEFLKCFYPTWLTETDETKDNLSKDFNKREIEPTCEINAVFTSSETNDLCNNRLTHPKPR